MRCRWDNVKWLHLRCGKSDLTFDNARTSTDRVMNFLPVIGCHRLPRLTDQTASERTPLKKDSPDEIWQNWQDGGSDSCKPFIIKISESKRDDLRIRQLSTSSLSRSGSYFCLVSFSHPSGSNNTGSRRIFSSNVDHDRRCVASVLIKALLTSSLLRHISAQSRRIAKNEGCTIGRSMHFACIRLYWYEFMYIRTYLCICYVCI